jgi:hypothetical protein
MAARKVCAHRPRVFSISSSYFIVRQKRLKIREILEMCVLKLI